MKNYIYENLVGVARGKFAPVFLAPFLISQVGAVEFIDDFTEATLDADTWEITGGKTYGISDGFLVLEADGGDWASQDISTNQRYVLPPEGETTTITWTMGPSTVDTVNPNDDGRTVRYQVGIHSANETASRKEHWNNTTGGLWIDLDNINPADTTTASGFAAYANDTKAAQSQGSNLGGVTLNWNWQAENHVLKLELTSSDYSWFDGDDLLYTDSFEAAEIDTEFSNGFRVLALGMNFAQGRASMSFDKIEIENGYEPSALLSSFTSSVAKPISGWKYTLDWVTLDGTTVSINQGIGNVDASTTDGTGQIELIAPEVTEPTVIEYTLTATLGADTVTSKAAVEVQPSTLTTEGFLEEFDDGFLDETRWRATGGKSYTIEDGLLKWAGDGGNWAHGEIESLDRFSIPEGDNETVITWVLGPNTITTSAENGNALRHQIGIFSAFEDNPGTKQHWQNDEGGLWLDLINISSDRPDGVSGDLRVADDTKAENSDVPGILTVDIPEWDWQNENQEFSLVLTSTGFTWFNGDIELGGAAYGDYEIDTEFENGFGIVASAINYDSGRGPMSVESIEIINGAVGISEEIVVTDLSYDAETTTLNLAWTSTPGASYAIEKLTAGGIWEELVDGLDSDGDTTSTILESGISDAEVLRILLLE